MQDHMFLWWPGINCYSLAGKFWFICCIQQTLHLWISIYFGLYKILLMENISIHWKTVKGTWNSSLLKKIKSFGKVELWSCLKKWQKVVEQKGEYVVQWSSWWKWKMCLLFLLKNQRHFLTNPIFYSSLSDWKVTFLEKSQTLTRVNQIWKIEQPHKTENVSREKKQRIPEWNVSCLSPSTHLELNEKRRLENKTSRSVISSSQFGRERAERLNRQPGESRGEIPGRNPSGRPTGAGGAAALVFSGL